MDHGRVSLVHHFIENKEKTVTIQVLLRLPPKFYSFASVKSVIYLPQPRINPCRTQVKGPQNADLEIMMALSLSKCFKIIVFVYKQSSIFSLSSQNNTCSTCMLCFPYKAAV